MYSIIGVIESIAAELQKKLDGVTLKFKGSNDTSQYIEQSPLVYAYTYDDLSNGMPLHTPSVLVQCLNLNDSGVAQFLAHVCICNPAKQDLEITKPVKGTNGIYEYMTSKGIDSAGVRSELYRACLMLGERVFVAIKQMSNSGRNLSNVILDTPSPYMEKFPYCECAVSFDVEINQTETKIKTDMWNML